MKKLIITLFILIPLAVFAQKDTIHIVYQKNEYRNVAERNIKNIITYNRQKVKESPNARWVQSLYTDDINQLEWVSVPTYTFKKEILSYKPGDNMVEYIDFTNHPEEQDFIIYRDQTWFKEYVIPDKYLNPLDYSIKNNLPLPETILNNMATDLDLFKGFSIPLFYYHTKKIIPFHILDTDCFIYNGEAYVLEALGSSFKIVPFNDHYLIYLNYIKLKVQGRGENEPFSEYKNKNKIKKIFLKVEEK